MNEELANIIEQSSFTLMDGVYVYVKVKNTPVSTGHFMISHDADEITVVTTADRLHEIDSIERNKDDYALFALNVSIPFYCVGFLAEVTKIIADHQMNVLVVSTFSKDYIMVRHDLKDQVCNLLREMGFSEAH